MINTISKLPRFLKRTLVILLDIFFCFLSTWFAFYLRLGDFFISFDIILKPILFSIILLIPIFIFKGLYKVIFRHSDWLGLKNIFYAILIYGVIYLNFIMFIGISDVPRTIGFIQPLILLLLVMSSRKSADYIINGKLKNFFSKNKVPSCLIYGAGSKGRQIFSSLSNRNKYKIIGYLDDDIKLQSKILNGLRIYSIKQLEYLLSKKKINIIFLAIPNLSKTRLIEIIEYFSIYKIAVRKFPDIDDLFDGKLKDNYINELDINDLLGRKVIKSNSDEIAKTIFQKKIFISGAGGSIGSELAQQILSYCPDTLVLIDSSEFNLYSISEILKKLIIKDKKLSNVKVISLIGSVIDKSFIRNVLSTWKIDVIYHAAAYKHVPIVEYNLVNSIYNNVFGTLNLAEEALNQGVKKFVFISTDKAVRPKNIMGASKRLAEIILQSFDNKFKESGNTLFTMVRFGNVLKSSGSVIPKFRQQIMEGGPVTVTHPDINRFFMTISEAVHLVIQAGEMSEGGDVFVLDMGKPVKIYDLAKRMIKLSGLSIKNNENPNGDIKIEIIGLRPGEKLFEELLIGNNPINTSNIKIKKAKEYFIEYDNLMKDLNLLNNYLQINKIEKIIEIMKKLVTELDYSQNISDYMYNNKNSE